MTPTQGEHAQTALAHELFAAAQLAPGEGIEDAVSRIAAALTAAPAQPAAPQGVAYAMHQRVEELIEKESELRRVVEIIALGESVNPVIDAGDELVELGYWDAGAVAALRASNGQAPASRITVEQVEDAVGLQSTAWDTIGAEKIVEAVLRLANTQAPAAGAVAGPSETLAEWVLRATPAEFNARNWEAVHQGLLRARETLNSTGVTHSWIGPYIDIARQESQRDLPAAPTPAAQADSQPSSFGSPELQAMILARCVEKDKADSVLEDAAPQAAIENPYRAMTGRHEAFEQGVLKTLAAFRAKHAARKQGGKHDNH